MTEEAPKQATASLLTKLKALVHDHLEKAGLGPYTTLIHNESDKPIFLIPISCTRGANPLSRGRINKDLAKPIQPKKIELVNCSKYDRGDMNPDSETRILFVAASENTDSLGKFSLKEYQEGKGKMPHPHNFLYNKRDLFLTLKDGEVIVDEYAGQDGEKKKKEQLEQTAESLVTEIGTALENLIEDVEKLKKRVEQLEDVKPKKEKEGSESNTSCTR